MVGGDMAWVGGTIIEWKCDIEEGVLRRVPHQDVRTGPGGEGDDISVVEAAQGCVHVTYEVSVGTGARRGNNRGALGGMVDIALSVRDGGSGEVESEVLLSLNKKRWARWLEGVTNESRWHKSTSTRKVKSVFTRLVAARSLASKCVVMKAGYEDLPTSLFTRSATADDRGRHR
uniref:Uncharacterized protein n=1 Tax=Knipowitschia caucasica TaxID=637954 RepID=A0AAV2KYR2_KNICA